MALSLQATGPSLDSRPRQCCNPGVRLTCEEEQRICDRSDPATPAGVLGLRPISPLPLAGGAVKRRALRLDDAHNGRSCARCAGLPFAVIDPVRVLIASRLI